MKLKSKCEYLQIRNIAMDFVGAFLYLIKFLWKQYLRMLYMEREVWKRKEKLLSLVKPVTFKTFLFSLIIIIYYIKAETNCII